MKAKIAGTMFQPTEELHFKDGNKLITVQIENSTNRFVWRLIVNGSKSQLTAYYREILKHRGYCIASAYWKGTFPEFVPFTLKKSHKI